MTVFAISLSILTAVYVLMGVFFIAGLYVPHRRTSSQKPFVSVIIAARNEASEIGECLSTVLNQNYPMELMEVIVVDDRSTDETARIVETLANSDRRLRLVRVTDKPASFSGKKFALREGIRASRGELLLFTDADCRVGPQWVSAMVGQMTDDVGFVIGFSRVRADRFFERLQQFDFGVLMTAACGSANWGMPMAASGQNLAYRRDAYEAAGGLDSVMERISGDDVLMMHLIRRKTPYRTVFALDAASHVTTRAEPTLAGFLQQRTRWASNADMMIRLAFPFFAYLLAVYCFHIALFGGLLFGWKNDVLLFALGVALGNKLIVDALVSVLGARHFGSSFRPTVFMVWFVLQTPYTLWVGIRGLFKKFVWR